MTTNVPFTNVTCIKVANLRKSGIPDLRTWLEDPNNVYTGRRGRIFIDKVIFHYPGSKWQNPYKLDKYSIKESLAFYINHLFSSGLIYDIEELRGKNLGCFCSEQCSGGSPTCHAQVLADILNKCSKYIPKRNKTE